MQPMSDESSNECNMVQNVHSFDFCFCAFSQQGGVRLGFAFATNCFCA